MNSSEWSFLLFGLVTFLVRYKLGEIKPLQSTAVRSKCILSLPPVRNKLAVVQSLNRARVFATPWTAACQASLPFTVSWSLLKLTSVESVVPSEHLI